MSGLGVVLKREYLETVKKRSFVIWTVLMPVFFGALMIVPSLLMSRGMSEKNVLVLDGTGVLPAGLSEDLRAEAKPEGRARRPGEIHCEVVATTDLEQGKTDALLRLSRQELDAVLVVPRSAIDGDAPATLYSRSSADVITRERLESALNRAVIEGRIASRGIGPEDARALLKRVKLESLQATKGGETKKGVGGGDFLLVVAFGLMMLMPLIIHGQAILRGVVHEKSERIVESLLSSMGAFDLLTGKVLAMALVGLTQIAVWTLMGSIVGLAYGTPLLAMGVNLRSIISLGKLAYFVVFFVLGYFIYACVFATAGACVNNEKEGQQLIQPILMVLMLPWFMVFLIITDPDSRLVTVVSLIPIWTPVTMFLRVVVAEPPMWQVGLSIALCLIAIPALFWVAARVFRVGILWYGKRPSLPEFLRWVRQA